MASEPLSNDPGVETARRNLIAWTDCLLEPNGLPNVQREACQDWVRWGLGLLGIDLCAGVGTDSPYSVESRLSTGKAISPLSAARCVWEYRRTAVFLQAMDRALREAFARFPGETIQVMEAGCGPLAPLTLPFALRYPPERLRITLLDIHRPALDGALRLARELGVERSIGECIQADATELRLRETQRPHVIACELLLRALKSEPQVSVTRNLAPQLRPGGLFLPERIDVRACLFDARSYFRPWDGEETIATLRSEAIQDLGLAFSLDARDLAKLGDPVAGRFRGGSLFVPPHDPRRVPLGFFTKLHVFEDNVLECMDCSLTLFERLKTSEALASQGGTLDLAYQVSENPGLVVEAERLDTLLAPLAPHGA